MSESKPAPSQVAEKFIVRLPDGMRDRIANAAKANNRNMNQEVVARLQQSFVRKTRGDDVLFLISKFRADLADKELDKHILYLMLQELHIMVLSFGATLRRMEGLGPHVFRLVDEWLVDSNQVVDEAKDKLGEPLEAMNYDKALDNVLRRARKRQEIADALLADNDDSALHQSLTLPAAQTEESAAPTPSGPRARPKKK